MTTYAHLIYLVLDELKILSDDATYTEDHVMFLLNKYRGMLLKQQYKDIKKDIPESNFQTICLELEPHLFFEDDVCSNETYLRSKKKIPTVMSIIEPRIYTSDYYRGTMTYVSRDRMRYVGYNKWLQNITYCSLGPDNHLYFKSNNPQLLYLRNVSMTGVFENPEEASELECDSEDKPCNIKDRVFPIEEALVPQLVQLVVKELSGSVYRPNDSINNASDDLATMAQFIRNNMKSNMQKQIDGNE